MSETQLLLSRIAALRRQLEQGQGLAKDAASSACASRSLATSERETQAEENAALRLERQVSQGSKHTALLDTVLCQLTPDSLAKDSPTLPKQLTSRARRILE